MSETFLVVLTNIVTATAILIAAWLGGNWARKLILNIDKLDRTLRSFLGGLAKYAILAIAVVMTLTQLGIQTASLLAVLGAAGLAIGLALQGTLSNVSAGVMLLVIRPFNVGDAIQFNGNVGTVTSLGLFGTELNTLDNVYMYAPNSTIWNSDIYNFSRNPERRHDLTIGISYDDNIDAAMTTIYNVIMADERILKDGAHDPLIAVENLGTSSVDIKARIWTRGDHLGIKFDTIKAIKEALDHDGITIPFPTQTITYAKDAKPTPPRATRKTSA